MIKRIRLASTAALSLWLLAACASTSTQPPPPQPQARVSPQAPAPPAPKASPPGTVALPLKEGSLKFAVLGDFGDASKLQYDTAAQFVKSRTTFPFELVILTGDNLIGSERPQDFQNKFEIPYKPLLDAGVKFYGALGNHDAREQRYYELFNMKGKLYYSFKAPKQSVRFFALEATYMDPEQVKWTENELKNNNDDWKIMYFHQPLYSSGETHGSDLGLRELLEPLFIQYNVSVVFNGHDHVYERIKPQHDIQYFVVGSGGRLRRGDLNTSTGLTAKGFDADCAFMIVEIDGDQMFFNTISRTGQVVDSGAVTRRKPIK